MPRAWLHLLAWFTCLWCIAPGVQAAGVVVVLSESSSGYVQVRDAVLAELERSALPTAEVRVVLASDGGAMDSVAAERPRLWLTLGADALTQVLSRGPRVPVIAALIPRLGFERILAEAGGKTAQAVSALYLDQPFGRQLDLLRLVLPTSRRVGVLWGPESVALQRSLTTAMQSHGFEPVYGTVHTEAALFSGLKQALDEVDVLMAVADPLVFNSATVSNILLATYRSRIPVFAFSPAYVKAGALLSLHSTPSQIGVQAAAMVRVATQGVGVPPSQYPNDYVVGVNDYVARSLGLVLDGVALADRLRRGEKRP
jgi:putative ABC transport system substrate-binding protein